MRAQESVDLNDGLVMQTIDHRSSNANNNQDEAKNKIRNRGHMRTIDVSTDTHMLQAPDQSTLDLDQKSPLSHMRRNNNMQSSESAMGRVKTDF